MNSGMTRSERAKERRAEGLRTCPKQISAENRKLWLKMTPQQRTLATILAQGGTKRTEAFRIAYNRDPDDKRTTLYEQASVTVNNPKVSAMTEALIGTYDDSGRSDPAKTRRFVQDRLTELAADPKVPSAVQVNASVWLGKANHVRLFAEDQRDENAPVDDVRTALKDAIGEMFTAAPVTGADQVIDVSVSSETPERGELEAISVEPEPEPTSGLGPESEPTTYRARP